MGAGAAPGRFGKGVIALVVINPHGIVRRTCLMQGRSVFTKFKDLPEFEGLSIEQVKARITDASFDRGIGIAVGKALEQVEKVQSEKTGTTTNTAKAVTAAA